MSKSNLKLTNQQKLRKRAQKACISKGDGLKMHQYNITSKLTQSYWNTYHCQSAIERSENGTIITKFCKNRWCRVCQSNRMAHLINSYKHLEKEEEKFFVTLTAKTVDKEQLYARLEQIAAIWRNIMQSVNKTDRKLNGIRKLELKIAKGRKYHPHYHIVIQGKENAEWIVEQWLKRLKKHGIKASEKAQDIRECYDFIELFKYAVKAPHETDDESELVPTPQEADYIFQCLYKKRTIQPFGKWRKNETPIDNSEAVKYPENKAPRAFWHYQDWIDENGEPITGYEIDKDPNWRIPHTYKQFLKSGIPYSMAEKYRIQEHARANEFDPTIREHHKVKRIKDQALLKRKNQKFEEWRENDLPKYGQDREEIEQVKTELKNERNKKSHNRRS